MTLMLLLPALLLGAGGALAVRPALVPARWWGRLVGLAPVLALAATALLGWRLRGGPVESSLIDRPEVELGLELTLRGDAVSVLLVGLTALLALVTTSRTLEGTASAAASQRAALAGPLLVTAATALFAVASCRPLGLAIGWALLDLALAFSARTPRRVLLTSQLGLLLALAGLMALPGGRPELCGVGGVAPGAPARWLLLGAAAVRLGVYPLWWSVPRTPPDTPWALAGLRLAPTVAAAAVAVRLAGRLPTGSGLSLAALAPLALVALACGLLARKASQPAARLDWLVAHSGALILVGAAVGGPLGTAIALALLVDLVLSGTARAVRRPSLGRRADQLAGWLAAASLAGLPPLLGFTGRWWLYRELLGAGLVVLLALLALATTLATLPPRPSASNATSHRGRPMALLLTGLGLLLALLVTHPALGPVLDTLAGPVPPPALRDAFERLRSPLAMTRLQGLALLGTVVVPPALGWLLAARRRKREVADEVVLRHTRQLSAAARTMSSALVRAGDTLHRGSGLVEGRRAIAWTLLAATAVGVSMLTPASGPQTAAPPSALGLMALALAALVTAGALLTRSPGIRLLALTGGYLLSAAVLLAVGGTGLLPLAVLKALVGLVVVGILAVGVLQAPLDRRLADAARRLRALHDRPAEQSRLVPALALAVALALSYGAASTGDGLPPDLLRPTLALIAGGVLSVVFARSALGLATGVLLALAGFELAYAVMDSGLLITGVLAGFQLLFAIVASYYVGAGPTSPATNG